MSYRVIGFALLLWVIASSSKAAEWIYIFQRGDNLWNLSRRFLKDINLWPELQSFNGIRQPRRLQPGTQIHVPMEWLKIVPGSAKVLNLYGNVTVLETNQTPKNLAIGDILKTGDSIQTKSSSNVTLQFADGSTVLLKSKGKMKLKKLKVYPGTGMVDTRLEQIKGRSESKVTPKKGPGSRFEIKTPSAVAGVRGTAFRVEASSNGEVTNSEVTKGEVKVQAGGAKQIVPQGFGTLAKAGEPPLPPIELLPAPKLTNLPSSFEQEPFYFRFPHITGAISYQLEIAPDRQFTQLLFDHEFPSTTMKVATLPDGNYVLRVRAVDHKGLEGFNGYHPFSVNTHPRSPKLLQPLPATRISSNQPIFRWRACEKSYGYQLQLATDFHFHNLVINESRLPSQNLITSLLPPGRYYWRVAALDSQGKRGPFSPGQSFFQLPPPPAIEMIEQHGGPTALRWQEPYDDAHYRIQIAWDPEFTMVISDARLDKPPYRLPPLKQGQYFVRIKTYSSGWEGPFSQPIPLLIPSQP